MLLTSRSHQMARGSSVAAKLICGALLASLLLASARSHANSYHRLEAAFNLPGIATDVFDYLATDVTVQWRLPDNTTLSLPAFFDGGTTWRVRHTPRVAGPYSITGVTLNGSTVSASWRTATNWVIEDPATGPGYIRIDPGDPKRFVTDDTRRFFPVGHNVAWNPTVSNDYPRIFQRMGAARENWTWIWMTHFYESLNLDWPKVNNTLGQLSLMVAQRWDLIMDEAEKAGVAAQVVFQHHGQYASTNGSNVNPNWEQNPYNTANGGFLSDAAQFFTNATAKALTKRKLRYAIARWGYSTSIMAWELFNEVQFTDAAYAGQWPNIAAWHREMAGFLRTQDPYAHLITSSSDLTQDYWSAVDYYQNHNYASDMLVASRDPSGPPASWPVKPIFDGESSQTSPPQLWVHAPIWAALMAGQAGGSCPWWWDTIDPENDYFLFKSMRDYVSVSGLAEQNNLMKSSPRVTGVPATALSFAPGGGWQPATKDVFAVADSAPDGIGSAPSYLQGVYHQAWTPNGYTFAVNYEAPGSFAVQLVQIAASGATFVLRLDGVTQTNVPFAGTGSDVSTNVTFLIPVPAGLHSIVLTNAGLDWLVLGNISLNPYVPMLGAYSVGNTNYQCVWVWHRTNLYMANATAALSGGVNVTGLQAGSYAAAWWDCYNGGTLSNLTISVPSNGAVVAVSTPAILRSAALHVGKAPQAALSGPALTQILASNAPPVFTSLALSNNGGLPLQYSLSLTGLSPVMYTALNSTQFGGPAYVWRDVSAYGRNISGNFTALAAPKAAGDEGIAGPFDIGFAFPFFSGGQAPGIYTQVYVSPNGFITFSPFAGDRSANSTLPNGSSPSNLVALVWDDLDSSAGGKIYVASDPLAGEFTVQYDAVRFKSSALTATAQVVLRPTGEILCYYKSLGQAASCTVGVQNAARTQGLQVVDNGGYLQNAMALRMTPAGWCQLLFPAGFVPGGSSQSIDLAFRTSSLTSGVYRASLLVKTSDPLQPGFHLPVSLLVGATPIGVWRFAFFGSPDATGNAANDADWESDGLMNIFEYAFNTNPTNANASPLTYGLVNDHLTLTFPRRSPPPADIGYVVEVTDDLTGPNWESGPTVASEAIKNNGDGTETVIVTDLAPVSATVAHYARIRIVAGGGE
jgi:hypothetical protein